MAVYKKNFGVGLLFLFFFEFILGYNTGFVFKKAAGQTINSQQKDAQINYKKSMIELIEQISIYAKNKNDSFQLIQNDGLSLFQYTHDNSGKKLLKQVDGVLLEGLYYTWQMNDSEKTRSNITRMREDALKTPQKAGLTILNVDYCNRIGMVNDSLKLNKNKNIVSFAAFNRRLDRIPKYPWQLPHENDTNIIRLNQIKNFLVMLDPGKITAKQRYLTYLQDTNYDLLIIDLTYEEKPLLPEDVAFLKKKKNGATRLVFAYMSVGEAESYRHYWQENWNINQPGWLGELNPEWKGNFKVKYWSDEWKKILFSSTDSYLDMILSAGFDGVFMDVIDAYDYFEYKEQASK